MISVKAAKPMAGACRGLGMNFSVATSRAFSGGCHAVGLVPEHELAMGEAQQQMAANSIAREQDEKREHARNVELVVGIQDQEADAVLGPDELADQL